MKKLLLSIYFVIIYFGFSNALLFSPSTFAATSSITATETFQSNGITLELFDINTSAHSIPTGEKSIIAASSEFIVYSIEDELRGQINFVWNIVTKKNVPLESIVDGQSFTRDGIAVFNDHIYLTSSKQKGQSITYWQLHGNSAKKVGETASYNRVVEEFDGYLYLGRHFGSCAADEAILSRINLTTSVVESLINVGDFGTDYSGGDLSYSDCPSLAYDVKKIANTLYFVTHIINGGQWRVWQYDLTGQQLAEQPIASQLDLTEGWVRILASDNLNIITGNFENNTSSISVQILTPDNVLNEKQYINAIAYGWDSIGVFNNKLTYLEGGNNSNEAINMLQFDENTLVPEVVSTFTQEQLKHYYFINDQFYFKSWGEEHKHSLFSLGKDFNTHQVISNMWSGYDWQIDHLFKVIENALYYIGDNNEIWHYTVDEETELTELYQIELPADLLTNTIASAAHNFVTIQGNVYFIARNADSASVSIWLQSEKPSKIGKLINPNTELAFEYAWSGVVELFASKDYLLIQILVDDQHQWLSYSVNDNTLKEHQALNGFTKPLKSYDELENILHFEKDGKLWQYDIAKQALLEQGLELTIPFIGSNYEGSSRNITHVYFDERYLAYIEGVYHVNGELNYGSRRRYIELWQLSNRPVKKLFSSVEQGIESGEPQHICIKATQCMTTHKDSLILIAHNFHLQLDRGELSNIKYFAEDLRLYHSDRDEQQYAFSDGADFYLSTPDNRSDLFYFNEHNNAIKGVSLPHSWGDQSHYIIVGEAFYFLALNRYNYSSDLWLMSADKKDFTLVAEFPIYEGSKFQALDAVVSGNKFYWQQELFNNQGSYGEELAVLTLYQHASTISGEPETQLASQASYNFIPEAFDEYNLPFSFIIKNKPNWASFNVKTGELSGTPAYGDFGDYANITIAVSNGVKTSELTPFTISIEPPVFEHSPSISGTPITELNVGTTYNFTPQASDEYDLLLSFSISNKPSWASFDENTGQLSGTPASTDVASYENIVISVSNGVKASELAAFSINVNAIAAEPVKVENKSSSGSFSLFLLLAMMFNIALKQLVFNKSLVLTEYRKEF